MAELDMSDMDEVRCQAAPVNAVEHPGNLVQHLALAAGFLTGRIE